MAAIRKVMVALGVLVVGSLLFSALLYQNSVIPPANAAINGTLDVFLRLGDIKGESNDEKHLGEIDVLSCSEGLTHPFNIVGGRLSRLTVSDITFQHFIDSASPLLLKYAATGNVIPNGIFSFRKTWGRAWYEIYRITLAEVRVTSVNQVLNLPGWGIPVNQTNTEGKQFETVTLSFSKITWEYTPVKADGSPGPAISFSWDVVAKKEI